MKISTQSGVNGHFPGSIRAVISHPLGGRIVMSGFPGLDTTLKGEAFFDPQSCRETVRGIKSLGVGRLILLVERSELDDQGFDMLEEVAAEYGLALQPWPIVDYSVPSPEAYSDWVQTHAARREVFTDGGGLAFCCQYGAGRSGLMASLLLIEAGVPADEAIAKVRAHFSEAVESAEQETWLQSVANSQK